jgi:hypothetical protein
MSIANRKYFPTPPSLFLQNKHFIVRQDFFVIDKICAIFELLLIIKQIRIFLDFFFLSIKDNDLTFLSSSLLQENPLKYRNIVYIFIQSQHFPLIYFFCIDITYNSYFYIKCAKRVFFVHEKVFYAETKVEAV